MADTVKISLRNTVGFQGVLYGPGESVEVPQALADAIGTTPEEPVRQQATSKPLEEMNEEELRALAQERGVEVEPGGRRKNPNEDDYREALK